MYNSSQLFNEKAMSNVRYAQASVKINSVDMSTELLSVDYAHEYETLIGGFSAKSVEIKLKTNTIDMSKIPNATVEVGLGFNGAENVPMGVFYVENKTIKTDDIKKTIQFIAYDSTLKFDMKANQDLFTYPISQQEYIRKICELVGVGYTPEELLLDQFMIEQKANTDPIVSWRQLINQLAQANLAIALIDRFGNLTFKSLITSSMPVITYGGNLYTDFKLELPQTFDGVVLARSGTEDSIVSNNGTSNVPIKLYDNAYLDFNRQRYVDHMFEAINGKTYLPFEMKSFIRPDLDVGDCIGITDKQGQTHLSFITSSKMTWKGGLRGVIKCPLLPETQTRYELAGTSQLKANTEILVDKVKQEITTTIQGVDGRLTQTVANLDGIKTEVSGIKSEQDVQKKQLSEIQITNEQITQLVQSMPDKEYIDTKINELANVKENLVSTLPLKWEQGKIDDSGNNVTSGYHIRTINFYRVQSGPVTLQISPMLDSEIFLYDENYAFIKKVSTTANTNTFSVDNNSFFRVHVFNGKLIKPEEIENSKLKVENNTQASAWSLYPADILADVDFKIYQLELQSPNGWVIGDNNSASKIINATVYRNEEDVTATFEQSQFIWTRQSDYPDIDNQFNSLGKQGSILSLGSEFLSTTATYTCSWTMLGDIHQLVTMNNENIILMNGEELMITTSVNAIKRSKSTVVVKDESRAIAEQSTKIEQTSKEILLKADQATVDGISSKVEQQNAQISVQAKAIETKVSTTDFNGEKIVGLINVSPAKINMSALNIELNGYVTFTSLTDKGKSSINGGNIQAKTITVDHLNVTTLSAISSNLGAITGGSLNIGSKFSVNSSGVMTALSGQIGGWAITDTRLHTLNGSGGLFLYSNQDTSSQYNIISINSTGMTMFYVKKDGLLYARNADIAGKVTATSGEFKNVSCTNLTINGSTFNGTASGTGNFTGGYHTGASSFVGNSGSFGGGYHNNGSFSSGNFGGIANLSSGSLAGVTFRGDSSYAILDGKLAVQGANSTGPLNVNTSRTSTMGIKIYGTAFADSWEHNSDIRKKENFTDIHDEFNNFIYSLPIGTYTYKSDKEKTPHIGINANFVDKLLPKEYTKYLVHKDQAGFYTASYIELVPMLVKVVQSQNTRLIDLEYEIKKLKGEL